MKIAIIRKKYSFHGGAEAFSSSFIENLANDGHEVHIYAIKWQVDESHRNIHFHKVPAITLVSFLRDLTFAVSSFFQLRKRKGYYSIIQAHDKTLYQDIYRAGDGCHIEWLKQRWKRTGFTGKISTILNPYHWLILVLERTIFKGHKYKKIIAISNMVKKNITDNYGISPDDIEVIYNGVDLKKFHPDNRARYRNEIRQEYRLSDNDFVVLFVGSGFERKGVKYLIEAAESIPEHVTLMIVGKGGEAKLKMLTERQKIIFCGPQQEIHKYYAAADIFVFPTMYEPFGNVHLEALASGLPVITTQKSGASEIIKDGIHGFVIDTPEDIKAFTRSIETLIKDRDRLESMGNSARLLAQEFTFEKHMKNVLELYNRILSSCHSRASGNP